MVWGVHCSNISRKQMSQRWLARLHGQEPCAAGMDAEEGVRSTGMAGTCTHMCPDSEIERRLRIEDVAIFERPDPAVAWTDRSLAVKRFARNVGAPYASWTRHTHLGRALSSLQNKCSRPGSPHHAAASEALHLAEGACAQIEQVPEYLKTLEALQVTQAHPWGSIHPTKYTNRTDLLLTTPW